MGQPCACPAGAGRRKKVQPEVLRRRSRALEECRRVRLADPGQVGVSNHLYSRLAWLPAAPEEFSAECRRLPGDPADLGNRVQRLASHALDENQLNLWPRPSRKHPTPAIRLR